jgi:hypothetical protein
MKAYFKVKWSHGFEYTIEINPASTNLIESYARHLDSILLVDGYTVTNEKKQVINVFVEKSRNGKSKYQISLQK